MTWNGHPNDPEAPDDRNWPLLKSHMIPYLLEHGSKRTYEELFCMTDDQLVLVDAIYKACEDNYSAGGDVIVECYEPKEVLREFKSLDEVRKYCGLKIEQELNAREGTDEDHQLKRAEAHANWQ